MEYYVLERAYGSLRFDLPTPILPYDRTVRCRTFDSVSRGPPVWGNHMAVVHCEEQRIDSEDLVLIEAAVARLPDGSADQVLAGPLPGHTAVLVLPSSVAQLPDELRERGLAVGPAVSGAAGSALVEVTALPLDGFLLRACEHARTGEGPLSRTAG